MRKNLLLFFFVFGFMAYSTGCTSKKVDQESTEATDVAGEATEASDEISELDSSSGATDSAEGGGESAGTDEFAANDNSLDGEGANGAQEGGDSFDEFGDEPAATADAGVAAPADEGLESLATNEEAPPVDAMADDGTSEALPPEPTEPAMDSSMDNMAMGADETQGLSEEPPAPKVIPLQKMITTPYRAAGVIVNALYVARPGDTLDSVSQKIYGEDRTAQLKKINSTFARRDMKVGDKVYYNSPQRPNDENTVMTYYEDRGLAPEVYLSQPGDNIRTVAKSLLGHENSWKEIWATNLDIESKGELGEGSRLRYWTGDGGVAPAPTMATTTEPVAPPPPGPEMAPPPMPDEVAMQEAPPAPDMGAVPPPPPEPTLTEPPPPPALAESTPPPSMAGTEESGSLGEDQDQMMALAVGGILLVAAIAMFIIIRKKRARRSSGIDFHTATHTQID